MFPVFVTVTGYACELQACSPCKDQMLTELGQSQTKCLISHIGFVTGDIHTALPSVCDMLETTGR